MRKDYLGLWLDQDNKAVFIEKGKKGFLVTVKAALNGPCYKLSHLFKIGSKTFRMKAVWNITDKEYLLQHSKAYSRAQQKTARLTSSVGQRR